MSAPSRGGRREEELSDKHPANILKFPPPLRQLRRTASVALWVPADDPNILPPLAEPLSRSAEISSVNFSYPPVVFCSPSSQLISSRFGLIKLPGRRSTLLFMHAAYLHLPFRLSVILSTLTNLHINSYYSLVSCWSLAFSVNNLIHCDSFQGDTEGPSVESHSRETWLSSLSACVSTLLVLSYN